MTGAQPAGDDQTQALTQHTELELGPKHCPSCAKALERFRRPICDEHRQTLKQRFQDIPQEKVIYEPSTQQFLAYEHVEESQDQFGPIGDQDPQGFSFARLRKPTPEQAYPLDWKTLIRLKTNPKILAAMESGDH